MAQVRSETSRAHVSLDVAIAPGQKGSIDPTLIGVFDETLRRAQQPEHDRQREVSAPPEDRRPSYDARKTDEVGERQTRERDDKPTEPADRSVASEGETGSTDKVGAEANQVEPEAASEESPEQDVTDEDAAASEEQTTETEVDAEAVIVPVLEEPAVPESDAVATTEGKAQEVSSSKEVVEAEDPQASVSQLAETVPQRPSGEAGPDEATVATEEVLAAADQVEQDSGAEAESGAEQEAAKREAADIAESDEDADADSTKPSEDSKSVSAPAETSEDPSQDRESRHAKNPRNETSRHERGEVVSAQAGEGREALTDGPQTTPVEGGLATTPVPDTPAAPEAATTLPEPVAADPGANASLPQANGATEVVAGVESRSTNATGRINSAGGEGKGTMQGVDAAKFVQRVANAFSALGQRSGPIRLKLYPPELGSLRMEISVKNGALSARVEAETAAARSLLVDNLPMLRDRLAEQGIKVDRFDVGVSDQSQGGPSERPDDSGRSSRQTGRETDDRSGGHDVEGEAERHDEHRPQINGRLDVFI